MVDFEDKQALEMRIMKHYSYFLKKEWNLTGPPVEYSRKNLTENLVKIITKMKEGA